LQIAIITGLLMPGMGNGGVIWAEQTVSSSLVALIVSMVPVWIVLIDWLRPGGRRPRSMMFLGLTLGFLAWSFSSDQALSLATERCRSAGCWCCSLDPRLVDRNTTHEKETRGRLADSLLRHSNAVGWCGIRDCFVDLSGVFGVRCQPRQHSLLAKRRVSRDLRFDHRLHSVRLSLETHFRGEGRDICVRESGIAVILGWLFAGEPIGARTLVAAAVLLAGVAIITTMQGAPAFVTDEHPVPTPSREPERSAV